MVALLENCTLEVLQLGCQIWPWDEVEVEYVELQPIFHEALEKMISVNTSIKHLSFATLARKDRHWYEVGACDAGIPTVILPVNELLSILQHSSSLQHLDISGCDLKDAVVRAAVSSFIRSNSSLTHLHMACHCFNLGEEDEE